MTNPDLSPWIADLEWASEPVQSRSRRTRAAILDALEAALARLRIDEIAVADLASEAEVSVGAVYHHFKNKRDLVYALLDRHAEETLATIDDAFDPERWEGASIRDVVRGYMQYSLARGRSHPGVGRERLRLSLEDGAVASQLEKLDAARDDGLAALLRARRDEIGHPNPDRAIWFVLEQLSAQMRARLYFARLSPVLVDDDEFTEELVESTAGFLRLRGGS